MSGFSFVELLIIQLNDLSPRSMDIPKLHLLRFSHQHGNFHIGFSTHLFKISQFLVNGHGRCMSNISWSVDRPIRSEHAHRCMAELSLECRNFIIVSVLNITRSSSSSGRKVPQLISNFFPNRILTQQYIEYRAET